MENRERIYLSPPHLTGGELKLIQEAFQSNWVAPVGPHLFLFEEELKKELGINNVLAVNSGTAAMHLALRSLGVGNGDIVIAQTFTFIGSISPAGHLGAKMVFVDSESATWNMDANALERALLHLKENSQLNKVKAIVVVHIYGMPANMTAIIEVAKKFGVPVIEDAAQSIGSKYNSRHTGTLGKLGVFSFNGNKVVTTSSGGAVISGVESLVDRMRFLSQQAREDFEHYEHRELGYNYRLSNVLAGIGRAQLKELSQKVVLKRNIFLRYKEYFTKWARNGVDIQFQEEPSTCFSNRWLSSILVDSTKIKQPIKEIMSATFSEANIESRPLFKPMHMQPVFQQAAFFTGEGLVHDPEGAHSVAGQLFEKGLCLPSGTNMTEHDWQRITDCLDEVLDKVSVIKE